jgi:hypothetical protein
MATPSCPGTVSTGGSGEAICTEDWVGVEPFSLDDIDFDTAASAFAAGFVIVGTAWAIGWSARAVLRAIGR